MPLPNPGQSFDPFDTLPASDLNDMVENIEALADGSGLDDGAIETDQIDDEAITPNKLGLGAQTATVAADQPTVNTTYVDLSTPGPSVTVTIGDHGMAILILSCDTNNNGQNHDFMSFAASGANTIAATDAVAFRYSSWVASSPHQASRVKLLTGLAPGSTTFTAKYRTTGSTGNFSNREITVIPL